MISVQYTAIRPINCPVNHETRVLLLRACVRVCVCVRASQQLQLTERRNPNSTELNYNFVRY
jgi:hypothetical protein